MNLNTYGSLKDEITIISEQTNITLECESGNTELHDAEVLEFIPASSNNGPIPSIVTLDD